MVRHLETRKSSHEREMSKEGEGEPRDQSVSYKGIDIDMNVGDGTDNEGHFDSPPGPSFLRLK